MNKTDDQIDSHIEDTKSNLIIRLYRGDISLPITYWVFGIGTGLIFKLCSFFIESNLTQIILIDYGLIFIKAFYWIGIIISLFMMVAIWRSANKYEKSPGWASVAKVIVVLNVIIIFITLYNQYSIDPEVALKNEVLLTNNSLPIMIDGMTRFDRMSLDERNLHYHYTLINTDKSEVDLNFFIVKMHTFLSKNSCDDSVVLGFLNDDRKLVHVYNDKNNDLIIDITIERTDCD